VPGTYKKVVKIIKECAERINPTGSFIHGKRFQVSQLKDTDLPLIYLLPYTITDGEDWDTHNILMGFLMQDAPDSNTTQTENIQYLMNELCAAFQYELQQKEVRLENITTEPQAGFQGTLSGFALSARLIVKDDCAPDYHIGDYEHAPWHRDTDDLNTDYVVANRS
jgi:hypothetical protein